MTKFFKNKTPFIGMLIILVSFASPAQSRVWSHDPANLARDYASIIDNRGKGEVVAVLWLAPVAFRDTPATHIARELLDKYVVIGVVDAHASKDGTVAFNQVTALDASDGSGRPLKSLNLKTMPPAVVGMLAALQSVFGRSMGAFGQGIHWFVFDGATTHACTKGGLIVPFAGEKYTYSTPIPGCP